MLNTLYSITFITLCLFLGKALNITFGGLPSSLYGMIIFTLILHFKWCDSEKVKDSITWSIRNMGICFVPAGVGIINHLELIKIHGIALISIIFITTFLILTFVGFSFQLLESKIKN